MGVHTLVVGDPFAEIEYHGLAPVRALSMITIVVVANRTAWVLSSKLSFLEPEGLIVEGFSGH